MFTSVKARNVLSFSSVSCWAFCCLSCCVIDSARCLDCSFLNISNSFAKLSTYHLSASICSFKAEWAFSLEVMHFSILRIWAALIAVGILIWLSNSLTTSWVLISMPKARYWIPIQTSAF